MERERERERSIECEPAEVWSDLLSASRLPSAAETTPKRGERVVRGISPQVCSGEYIGNGSLGSRSKVTHFQCIFHYLFRRIFNGGKFPPAALVGTTV